MRESYGRDLDLNLLRVFVAVAEAGSVTRAAAQLYLTQPAVSAALRRLTTAVGTPLFVRRGRGVMLSTAGTRMLAAVRPHLEGLIAAALSPPRFEPATSEHIVRVGLSDTTEGWILPALLRALATAAPRMSVIAVSVQFRTVAEALTSRRIDVALSIADELPPSILRREAFHGRFVCLYDPRHTRIGRAISERTYFAHEHVIVSYNADLRGVIEDMFHKQRRVRCSLASFSHVGDIVDGTALLATVPASVAAQIRATRPHLKTATLPFPYTPIPVELLWPTAVDEDPACRFVRDHLMAITARA